MGVVRSLPGPVLPGTACIIDMPALVGHHDDYKMGYCKYYSQGIIGILSK